MPPRPSLCAVPLPLRTHHYLLDRQPARFSVFHPTSAFHSSSRRHEDSFPDHYATLDLSPTASEKDVKRQFFALSKRHHPDTSPSPSLPRFHAINDAYHTLIDPHKRAAYDRDYSRAHGVPGQASASPQGSHSSHSYAGSRPASGLSKRRGTFRGPPPSFYRNGAYGAQGAKRSANQDASAAEQANASASNQGQGGGFGPGQASGVFGGQTPHFDSRGHTRTHESLLSSQARRRVRGDDPRDYEGQGGGQVFLFFVISGTVVIGLGVAGMWNGRKAVGGIG